MKHPALLARSAAGSTVIEQVQQVLIVDADESSRSVLSVAFGRERFEVLAVSGAAEALRLLAPGMPLPELLVIAAELRDHNGSCFAAQLRADLRLGAIPMLALARADEPQLELLSGLIGPEELLLKPLFARDLATLARLRLCPAGSDGARTLDCETAPPAHLLRAVLATSQSGVIELEEGRGHIAFRRGRVLDANFDGLHGLNGLVRVLALARGPYRIAARNLAFGEAFHCTLKELIAVVFPRLQKWEELIARSLPLDAQLGLDFSALARGLTSMPDAVNGVVRLFDGVRDVRQVLIDSPLDETVTLEIATRLFLMGVVVPLKSDEPSGIARRDPRLFEPMPTEAVERMDQLFSSNPTPIQAPAQLVAPGDDWALEPRGTGVEPGSDPSAGWATAQRLGSEEGEGLGLAEEVLQQLSAFNIQPVVEHEAAPVFATDLLEFALGEAASERPLEDALTAPIPLVELAPSPQVEAPIPLVELAPRPRIEAPIPPVELAPSPQVEALIPSVELIAQVGPARSPRVELAAAPVVDPSVRALEQDFFAETGTGAPALPGGGLERVETRSVSEAVLGLRSDEAGLPQPAASSRLGAIGWAAMVALLIGATAITAWQLSEREVPAPVPTAPVVAAGARAIEAQPPSSPGAGEVEPLAPVIEAAAPADSAATLVTATRLYDEGKIHQAKLALEELVTEDSSNTSAWLMLGLARFDSNDIPGAEEAANTVLAIDPTVARAHLLRATILIDAKKRDLAAIEIQKYLDLEPNGAFSDEAKALLKR